MACRCASHAGSWYSSNGAQLQAELRGYLRAAAVPEDVRSGTVRGVVCPHAGYRYSGPVAAWSYAAVQREIAARKIKRVFVLGPSHHVYMNYCGTSDARTLETPLGELRVDTDVIAELRKNRCFARTVSLQTDEDEHSLEMQYPYLKLAFATAAEAAGMPEPTVVPIMVGDLGDELFVECARVLAPFASDEHTLFVVSSDFCHWGDRFRYSPYERQKGAVHEYISWLDHAGVDAICSRDPARFAAYLKQTKNTICGRNPIQLFMHVMRQCPALGAAFKLMRYDQSSRVVDLDDSSVSYVAGAFCSST